MTTYGLIHGAGGSAWDWHLVTAELLWQGNKVIVPDLPCEDDAAGLAECAVAVLDGAGTATVETDEANRGRGPLVWQLRRSDRRRTLACQPARAGRTNDPHGR
jgi:hypothetical protein